MASGQKRASGPILSRHRFGSRLLKINRYYDGRRGCGQEQSDDPIVALITHRCINQLASIPSIVRREALKRNAFWEAIAM